MFGIMIRSAHRGKLAILFGALAVAGPCQSKCTIW
jgi:hypothetical protein